jgi:hypothetical protein
MADAGIESVDLGVERAQVGVRLDRQMIDCGVHGDSSRLHWGLWVQSSRLDQ